MGRNLCLFVFVVLVACGQPKECVRSHEGRVYEPDLALNCAIAKPQCAPLYYHWVTRTICDEWRPIAQ